MYRTRTKQSAKRQAAIEAREGIPVIPVLRRQIIIIDHDFGTVEHRIDLFRTNGIEGNVGACVSVNRGEFLGSGAVIFAA